MLGLVVSSFFPLQKKCAMHLPSRRQGHPWLLLLLTTIGALTVFAGCTSDQLPEPTGPNCGDLGAVTYQLQIKPIIDQSCAYSGCHLDSSPGNFSSYEGLVPYLESNQFRQRVLLERADPILGMPPDNAPANRPIDLTDDDIHLLECWLDAGYPES